MKQKPVTPSRLADVSPAKRSHIKNSEKLRQDGCIRKLEGELQIKDF